MIPTSAEIAESTIHVLALTLGMPAGVSVSTEPLERTPSLVACVTISGNWQGALTLEMPVDLARSAASTMFLLEDTVPDLDQVTDALGELANQLAGSLKAVLASGSQLSLPTVTEGCDYRVRVIGSVPISEARLMSGGSELRVVLHQRNGPAA